MKKLILFALTLAAAFAGAAPSVVQDVCGPSQEARK